MADQSAIAIAAQLAALRTIAIAAGFQTNLGARVLTSPYQPDGEDPAACIYRSGPLGMDQVRVLETYRMTVTWSALVTGAPDELDGMALSAQSTPKSHILTDCWFDPVNRRRSSNARHQTMPTPMKTCGASRWLPTIAG